MRDAGEGDITDVAETQSAEAASSGVSISFEVLAWLGLIGAAGLLRLVELDSLPLTTDEAARALDGARVAAGETPSTWRGDLAAAITSHLFRIFGEDEFVARIVPATAGVALLAVIWLARRQIGALGALTAVMLVAFSPLFVTYSRSATAFIAGTLLAAVMVVSLFGYLRSQRAGLLFALVTSLALAPLTDPPAVVAALAVITFLALEWFVFANCEVRDAWRALRSSPLQWLSALLVVAAALQLGLTHFGTSLERTELPGLSLFADMFDLPRDGRPPEYHFALLLAYDWPVLVAGTAGFAFLVIRFARGRDRTTPFERFLLIWTAVAALTLALVTRREAGQLLMLLLPLALLSGRLTEEVAAALDWRAAARWWPVAATIAMLIALIALLITEWATGQAGGTEKTLLIASPVACIGVLAAVSLRSPDAGVSLTAGVVAVVAVAFMSHSSLAAAFEGRTEFAVDARLQPRAERLRDTLDRLAAERNGAIVVDGDLIDELGWTLRDSPVVFGGPIDGAAAVLTRPDATPAGFVGRQEVWRVAQGWYPDEVLAPRGMWRWLLHRRAYEPVEGLELRIFVRTI